MLQDDATPMVQIDGHTVPEHFINDFSDPRFGHPHSVMPCSAWIAPDGKFFPVPYAGHGEFAFRFYEMTDLECVGWVHLSQGRGLFYDRITQSQIDILFDVLMVYRKHCARGTNELERDYMVVTMGRPDRD